MPFELEAKCPCCGKEAKRDKKRIEQEFGWRNLADGKEIPQSYCRVCRSARCHPGEPNH